VRSLLAACLLAACLVEPCHASTFFYARGQGADVVGRQAIPPVFHDPTSAIFRVQGNPADSLQITVRGTGEQPWHIVIRGPGGGPIVPGTFQSAGGDPFPVVVVNVGGQSCASAFARLTVHGIQVVDGAVTSLTVDFEQRCSGDVDAGIFGSLRHRTGAIACSNVAPGTPCDDFDACTPAATCGDGECLPAASRTPCTSSVECHKNGVCDPLSAVCSPPAPLTATPCDDGSACTTEDMCHTGVCSGAFLDCNDDSPCTMDTCDPESGCSHVPLAGECWALAGRTVTRISAAGRLGGRRVRCRARCMAVTREVLLLDGAEYRLAEGPTACTSGTFDLTDEVGTLVAGRRGQTTFEAGNFEQVRLDLLACMQFELVRRQRVMRLAGDGASLTGELRTSARMTQAVPSRVSVKTTFNGRPYDPDALPAPPAAKRLLEPCENGLPVRCLFDRE